MKRLLKILLPITLITVLFIGIYFVTLPKVQLPDFEEVNSALITLEKYGYESSQIASNTNYQHFGICFSIYLMSIITFFWVYDYFERQKIKKVIDYARKINEKIYNLELDKNDEGELSLLANELYKTTVILQEAAKTDKKRAKNMETALADISHQLRTPLTSLQITLDNLYDNPDLDIETRQEFLKTAGRQVEQMSELVVTLLNLAKLDNGTLKMHPENTAVSKLLENATERLAVLAEVSNVAIRISGDKKVKVDIDLKWQIQAITNILKNCIEHSKSGQSVNISIAHNAVFTRIIISDSGEGISSEDLKHIFERFYKAKNAKTESIGIGLSFAKTMIEADGGQIKVKSKEGIGTTFEITYYNK